MPTFTFRLSDDELERLNQQARAQGRSMAALVRDAIGFGGNDDLPERVDALESRMDRVEQIAGLS